MVTSALESSPVEHLLWNFSPLYPQNIWNRSWTRWLCSRSHCYIFKCVSCPELEPMACPDPIWSASRKYSSYLPWNLVKVWFYTSLLLNEGEIFPDNFWALNLGHETTILQQSKNILGTLFWYCTMLMQTNINNKLFNFIKLFLFSFLNISKVVLEVTIILLAWIHWIQLCKCNWISVNCFHFI